MSRHTAFPPNYRRTWAYDTRGIVRFMIKVGQNCMYTPYMTVYLVEALTKIP